jgi:hypothetical protein
MAERELTHLAIWASQPPDRYGRVKAFCGELVPIKQLARNGDATCEACRIADEEDMKNLSQLIEA